MAEKQISQKKYQRTKRWLWFIGLYFCALTVVGLFSMASRYLLT